MRQKGFAPALCALALTLALTACQGGGGSSSGSTLAEGSNPVVNESSSVSSTASSAVSSQPQETEELHMMTVEETMDFFNGLSPSVLGLPGESMSEYQIYPSEKAVPVDGLPCMKIIVYGDTSVGTNEPEGIFLLARDASALYHLVDGEVTQLDMG